ncbi:MAG TPA: ABC-2 family transporter protein [Chloroflexota bacterium]|jgi:ABC-type uncharacterized transport system permease subunit|nr:ABC-2 family transporter protein [Chloroflexota bacterium]
MSRGRLRRYAVLLWGYLQETFLSAVAYRGFLFTLAAERMVPPLVGMAVWSTALPDRQPELATYFTALLAVRMLTVCYENVFLAEAIYGGTLTDTLLRPHPAILHTVGTNLAYRLWHGLMVIPLLVAIALLTPVRVAPADVLQALPALAIAAALRFLFTYILALAAFWTQRAGAIVSSGGLLLTLLGGEAAPIPLLPSELQPWLAALPFRAMLGFPAEVTTGMVSGPGIVVGYAWQLIWLLALTLLARHIWGAGLRRFTAVGG